MNYSMNIATTPRSAYLRLVGDLDYESVDDLVANASRILAEHADLVNLHLDFTELTFLDSAALSGLLLIHRRTSHSGVALHLDHRPPFLNRVLEVTGLYGHFAADSNSADGGSTLLGQATSGDTGGR